MGYGTMGDEEILRELARQVEKLRISKQMKESELEKLSGVSRKTLYNFKRGSSSISLRNFIRILKALGELERLEQIFPEESTYSPMGASVKEAPRRVRDKKSMDRDFRWGDEQ